MRAALLALLLAGCSTARASECSPPEPADACVLMERTGLVSVTCERDPQTGALMSGGVYASADDDCDDTAGIRAAAQRARGRSTVWLPAGELSPWPESSPYIVSGSIDVTAVQVRGERGAQHHQGTRVIVAPGVTLTAPSECDALPVVPIAKPDSTCAHGAVFRASAITRISDVVIEAGPHIYWSGERGTAAYGVYLYRAHGAQLSSVVVRGASSAGIVSDYSHIAQLSSLVTVGGALDGLRAIGANQSRIDQFVTAHNGRHGLVISTRPQADAGATGETLVIGGSSEANGGAGVFVTRTWGPVTVLGTRAEGNTQDGYRVESASLVSLLHNRAITGPRVQHPTHASESLYHGVALAGCRACTVRGNAVVGSAGAEDIWLEGDIRYAWIAENIYFGGTSPMDYPGGAAGAFQVVQDVGGTLRRYSQHSTRSLAAAFTPTDGAWRVGDVVWSTLANGPRGWTCAQTGGLYSHACTRWAPVSQEQ